MPVTEDMRATIVALWHEALQVVLDAKPTWVLRDFHSPNLIWLPERQGIARVGLLDFQDAMMGPAAYDLASLLQDARVDVPELMEVALLGHYVKQRTAVDPDFEPADFIRLYATLAAQRASKILGIFARLDRRDGKPQYLRHIPRVWGYLQRSLAHPALAALQGMVHRARAGAGRRRNRRRRRPAASRRCRKQGTPEPMSTERQTTMPRTAMVLAAGLGERMRPLTERMPKPLVPVAGKPLLDHVLDRLAAAGVERAVVNVHYLADQIERHVASRQAPQIVISDERAKLLNTGGGVVKALPKLGAEPFFHVNSDTIWIDGVRPNLRTAGRSVRPGQHGRAAAAGGRPTTASAMPGRGDFPMAADGRLTKRAEPEIAPFVYAGAALLRPELFRDAPDGAFSLTALFDRAARSRPAARPAARRRVDACRHAGRHRAGRGRDHGQRRAEQAGTLALSTAAPICATR